MSTTKEKIVELARDAIQKVGYHSFNYKQIALELNIKNAAIHHYFPTKEDLGLAVIEKDRQDFNKLTQQTQKASSREKLEALIALYHSFYQDNKKLCVIGTFSAAYGDVPEKLRVAAGQYLEWIQLWLITTFKEGLKSGEFTFTQSPEEMTNRWLAALPGTLQISRLKGLEYFHANMDDLRAALKAA